MLNIDMKKADGELRIDLEGQLGNLAANDLGQQIEAELDGVHRIVFDLDKLDYISSLGLRILIASQKHMEAAGGENVCVRNAKGAVLDTLEMTGFTGVINVE